jgi:hypothetical protein
LRYFLTQQPPYGFDFGRGMADPESQGRPIDRDPLPRQDLGLAIRRAVVGVLRHDMAINCSVGRPPSLSRAGADAWTTPFWQVRQAYFGRRVTITRYCAGMTSSRCEQNYRSHASQRRPNCIRCS